MCEFFFNIQMILSANTDSMTPGKTLQIPIVPCPQHSNNHGSMSLQHVKSLLCETNF